VARTTVVKVYRRHEPVWNEHLSLWQCKVCYRGKSDSRAKLFKQPCRGYGATVIQWSDDRPPDKAHRLWELGGFVWCATCSGFSQSSARLLCGDCRGYSAEHGRRALRWLFEGKSPYSPHAAI
jgi:hypothetical protein